MYRTVYVLVYPSRLFSAHWSFWLPYTDSGDQQSNTGDRIHVTGDRLNGFQYEYDHNYDIREDDRNPNAFPIGLVLATHLSKAHQGEILNPDEEDQKDKGDVAFNALDEACREVPAPGPGLNKVSKTSDDKGTGGPPKRSEVRDCQSTLR